MSSRSSFFARAPRVSTASSRRQSDCTFQMIARAAGVHSASAAKTVNDGWRRNPQLRLHLRHTCRGSWCRHERWKFEWGKPQFTRLEVRNRVIRVGWPDHDDFRSTPVNGHAQDSRACLRGANRKCSSLDRAQANSDSDKIRPAAQTSGNLKAVQCNLLEAASGRTIGRKSSSLIS